MAGLTVLLAAPACGGGSGVTAPSFAPARSYELGDFRPSQEVAAGTPVKLSFTIVKPDGSPLARYRTGAGPHTGVHVLLVRDDLSALIHVHPPIGRDGEITETVRFPSGGRWELVVDAYPQPAAGVPRNFQLKRFVDVSGPSGPALNIPPGRRRTVGGLTFELLNPPKIHALQPYLLNVSVTKQGRPVTFQPWFGALGHAIFFRRGSLTYFHTHICGKGAAGCAAGSPIAGVSQKPGLLSVGVLLPQPGTWRLFLQCKVDGTVVTVPYTLRVA
jgi:hypothetical protein